MPVDISHILGNLITVIFDYQIDVYKRQDIKEHALGLVEIYHQKIDWKAEQSDKKVTIDYDPMFRAVMNVIQNAVEHTKENGIIYIDAKEQDDRLTFCLLYTSRFV